jgi:hypothetical protein
MNNTRKLLCSFAVVALATFALPAFAADKLFTLSAKTFNASGISLDGMIPAGAAPSVLLLDFANQSPTGANSVMKAILVNETQPVPADVKWAVIQATTVNGGGACPAPPTNPPVPTGAPGATIQINNITGVKPAGHFCLYLAVTTNLTSCTAATWTGQANTGNSFNGTAFADFNNQTNLFATASTSNGCTGVLGCTTGSNTGGFYGSLVLTQPGFEGRADWGLVRSFNTNGETCTLVPYQFNFSSSSQTASFIAGNKGTQAISTEYVVLFDPIPYAGAPDGSWPNLQPLLAWGTAGVPAAGDYVPALACLNDEVDPTKPGGSDAEVLPKIPDDSASTATYTYAAAYALGNTQYAVGNLARMCVANHGWTAIRDPAGFPAGAYIQPWYKIIDRSDGYVRLP